MDSRAIYGNGKEVDDVVLCAKSQEEAQSMLDDLNEASRRIGLETNQKKTQYMKNAWCPSGRIKLEG
ncbi:hypothetical protein OESDEN_13323 [Oesophagostomum dentatum]|uniref:Reverse transcriptase domain-containing protein n=1 Tax=Oesophagostomum dentatum TaxID=61180 RepID=A0A0B1SNJ5_OESDE|nr:hypothetical protein OESDEN_13323 [Oesophagostomum dentatum]